jgi:hypothetical protein
MVGVDTVKLLIVEEDARDEDVCQATGYRGPLEQADPPLQQAGGEHPRDVDAQRQHE